jgi:rhodanese-related sulfurtransferase
MQSRITVRHGVALAALFVALLAGCSSSGEKKTSAANGKEPAQAAPAFARLDPAAFAERMNDNKATVINVHIPYEGELEQTDAFIPYDKVLGDSRLPRDKSSEILLYCRSGRMSEEAGNALHAAGYTNLAHLEGGMRGWEAAGHTLIHNPAHATSDTSMPMQHS